MRRPALLAAAAAVVALVPIGGVAPANAATARSAGPVPADAVAAGPTRAASAEVKLAAAAIAARIVAYVDQHGTKYTFGTYVHPTSGKIVVDTDAPAAVRSAVVGAYGPLVQVIRHGVRDAFNRRDDIPPFWGGSGVTPVPGSPACSSGYVVRDAAGTRFLTANGNCFANGVTVFTESGNQVVGTANGSGLPSRDMILIGGQTYAPFIFVGGPLSSTGAHVASAADSVIGFADYCHSGRTTGEQCGHTSLSNSATVCTSSGCKSPVTALSGGLLPQAGDGGSPLFVHSSGAPDVHIRGHYFAVSPTTMYAEKYSRLAAFYGVTIAT